MPKIKFLFLIMTYKDLPICLNSLPLIVPYQCARHAVLPNPEHAEFIGSLRTLSLLFVLSSWSAQNNFLN